MVPPKIPRKGFLIGIKPYPHSSLFMSSALWQTYFSSFLFTRAQAFWNVWRILWSLFFSLQTLNSPYLFQSHGIFKEKDGIYIPSKVLFEKSSSYSGSIELTGQHTLRKFNFSLNPIHNLHFACLVHYGRCTSVPFYLPQHKYLGMLCTTEIPS